jgi:GTPase involved in cell partitioning and DNA repair
MQILAMEEKSMFVDIAEIYIKAGDGGNGIVSFHRRARHSTKS